MVEGDGVIASARKLIGATKLLEAEFGTIRGDLREHRPHRDPSDVRNSPVRDWSWFQPSELSEWTLLIKVGASRADPFFRLVSTNPETERPWGFLLTGSDSSGSAARERLSSRRGARAKIRHRFGCGTGHEHTIAMVSAGQKSPETELSPSRGPSSGVQGRKPHQCPSEANRWPAEAVRRCRLSRWSVPGGSFTETGIALGGSDHEAVCEARGRCRGQRPPVARLPAASAGRAFAP